MWWNGIKYEGINLRGLSDENNKKNFRVVILGTETVTFTLNAICNLKLYRKSQIGLRGMHALLRSFIF